MSTRWQKVIRSTSSNEIDARQVATILAIADVVKKTAITLKDNKAKQYLCDRLGDMIIEILESKE